MTSADDAGLQQLVIGLTTQIYYANRDGEDPDDPRSHYCPIDTRPWD
ncbi:MAG TPA: hypothetical protein VFO16_16090 [Pseudonocardiaceae bacterium]|nr:hypothetical protein [Pseudonocardiaceae bacterium]